MIFHENRLPADDSHEIACLICYFGKSGKILHCCLLQIVGGALRVNTGQICIGLKQISQKKLQTHAPLIRFWTKIWF